MKTRTLLLSATTIAIALIGGATASEQGYTPPPRPPQTMEYKKETTKSDVREELVKPIRDALSLAKNNDFKGALDKIKEADAATSGKTPREEYIIATSIAQYSLKLNDLATATPAINRALATNMATQEELPPLLTLSVGLNSAAKNYPLAIASGEQLEKLGKADAAAKTNIAIAYYNSGNFPGALKAAKDALDFEKTSGGKPMEQTLIVLKNAQIKTGDSKGALQTEVQICDVSTTEPKAQCDMARKAVQSK